MTEQTIRTTVYFEKPLLYLAKKKALDEGKTLRQILKEALSKHLNLTLKKKTKPNMFVFGGHDLGKIKGSLRREEIYDRF